MSSRESQTKATNFIRKNYRNIGQRTLAKYIDNNTPWELPGWSDLDHVQQQNVREAFTTAGGISPLATIYNRIRRYDVSAEGIVDKILREEAEAAAV